jgi:PadR family transcriptional regulator PadR
MTKSKMDLLQGTLDLLILKTLELAPMHGWGITQRIEQQSHGEFCIGPGSLYPAMHRLEVQGWISSEMGTSENNRRARFYKLTAAGRKQLRTESENWGRMSMAMARILQPSD